MEKTEVKLIYNASSGHSEGKVFYPNGLGAFIIEWGSNSYEIIPVIGTEENHRVAEEYDEFGNLYTCTVTSEKEMLDRLEEIKELSF